MVGILVYMQAAPAGVWPITVSGWITMVGVIVGLLATGGGAVYGWGRWTQTLNGFTEKISTQLNGFGERVTTTENRLAAMEEHDRAMQRIIDTMLLQHGSILERLGEAKRASEQGSSDMDMMASRIESKLDAVRDTITKIDKDLSSRASALEATGKRLHHNT